MRICDLIKNQETYQAEMGQTVLETVRAMVERNIGAVPVLHNGKLVGIFSERDLMKRVVAEGCDPRSRSTLTRSWKTAWRSCAGTASAICPSAMKDNSLASSLCATFCCTV
jgi:CBS-domain-containing membrane protein